MTAQSGLRVYNGFFQVESGVIRVSEFADAWACAAGREMYGRGFDLELPRGVYALKLVEMTSVSTEAELQQDEFGDEALGGGEELLGVLIERLFEALADEPTEDDVPIYVLELQRMEHKCPPGEGPVATVWGPAWV